MKIETYSKITKDLTKEFEEFLYKPNSKSNPHISSPVWPNRRSH